MTGWLVGTLIATSALMALVLAVREAVRRRFGPAVVYALWLLPAARMVLPSFTRTVERATPAAAPPNLSPTAFASAPAEAAASAFAAWPTLLIAVWLIGAALMLARGLFVYAAQRRAILKGGVQLARIGNIRLVRSERVRGPLAFGILDRVIIVPLDFEHRFSERERCLALAHELAHHRSGDLIANAVAFVLLCLQWFNPLAWAAHAAFRFDQEAACDARVLDQAGARDRHCYGEAIAKAASGRTLLFAGALDRPSTLSRRLKIMTHLPTTRRRKFGFLLIGGASLLALPLSASWAVHYVDVPAAARPAPAASAPAAPMAAALAPAAAPETQFQRMADGSVKLPGGVILDKGSTAFFDDDRVLIDGQVKRVDDMSRAERAKLRAIIAKSRRDLERERAELPARLAEVRKETEEIRSGEFKRDLLETRADLRKDLAELDSQAAELRAAGENPEKLKAEILESLREAEAIDIDKQVRTALAELDPDKLVAEFRNAEAQMARLQARLEQLDRNGR